MIRQAQIAFIILTLFIQSIAGAAPSCRDLFVTQPIETSREKFRFIDSGIRNESRDAFKDYVILPESRRGRRQLLRYLRRADFQKIRSNQIVKISQIIADRNAPLFGQIKLVLTQRVGTAKANIVVNRLANQLALMSLYQAFEKEGRIKDIGILTRYKLYLNKYFPMVHAISTSIFSVYSVYEGFTANNFQGVILPQLQLLKYKNLSVEMQDHILDGIINAAPAVIENHNARVTTEMSYDILYRSFYLFISAITIGVVANAISDKVLGYRLIDFVDELFFRKALEKAAVDSVVSDLKSSGIPIDENVIRQQVHELSLKQLKSQINN